MLCQTRISVSADHFALNFLNPDDVECEFSLSHGCVAVKLIDLSICTLVAVGIIS